MEDQTTRSSAYSSVDSPARTTAAGSASAPAAYLVPVRRSWRNPCRDTTVAVRTPATTPLPPFATSPDLAGTDVVVGHSSVPVDRRRLRRRRLLPSSPTPRPTARRCGQAPDRVCPVRPLDRERICLGGRGRCHPGARQPGHRTRGSALVGSRWDVGRVPPGCTGSARRRGSHDRARGRRSTGSAQNAIGRTLRWDMAIPSRAAIKGHPLHPSSARARSPSGRHVVFTDSAYWVTDARDWAAASVQMSWAGVIADALGYRGIPEVRKRRSTQSATSQSFPCSRSTGCGVSPPPKPLSCRGVSRSVS